MIAMKRMWVNQPSTLQPHHALNGTNVLAVHEGENTMRVYFLSGDVISQQMSSLALSEGWIAPKEEVKPHEVAEVVRGLSNALSRALDKLDPDSTDYEWVGHANELHRKLTGHDVNG